MRPRPKCRDPEHRVWRFEAKGQTYRFAKASDELCRTADRWTERLVDWSWLTLYQQRETCLYALVTDEGAPLALFAMKPAPLNLAAGKTTRLDFFEVAPIARGGGLPNAAFSLFARLCFDFGCTTLAVQSLREPRVLDFYKDLGAKPGALKGWSAAKGLVAIGFTHDTLEMLKERADAFQEKDDA